MADQNQIAKAEEYEKKAEKKINSWGLFNSSKYDTAIDLYGNAANFFKLAKSWDRAGSVYIKSAKINLKLDCKHEAARAYADAATCFKKTNNTQAISCLDQAANLYMEYGRLNLAARYNKDIGELYEQEKNYEKAIVYYEQSAELFQSEEATSTANQLKQKIAQFSAHLGDYLRAIAIYEEVARYSVNNNLLKYGVRGHLLNAGLCQLCRGDVVAITNALEAYKELDPTFSGTMEYRFLAELAAAMDDEDIIEFTTAVKEFNRIISLDAWKNNLLSRVKDNLKAKEREEDDLT